MPKVICTDNYARDYNGGKSEEIWAENVAPELAKEIADVLNSRFGGECSDAWFVVQPDDYKPYIFEGY